MTTATEGLKKVLVVDDDPAVRLALVRSVKGMGYCVRAASGGQEGLEMLQAEPADIIISDYLMPTMTGMDFLRAVRTRFPDTIRILLTGHAETQVAIDGINQGELFRFLTKPWDNTEVWVTLHIGVERLELERQNRRALAAAHALESILQRLKREEPAFAASLDAWHEGEVYRAADAVAGRPSRLLQEPAPHVASSTDIILPV